MSSRRSEKLAKSDRILKRDRFREVYETGRKVPARYFTAFLLENEGKTPRIGITATRKTGGSVARNRARRLVRILFRKNKWLVQKGVDIVVNVRPTLAEADYDELEIDFLAFLRKAGNQ